jgi:hypothetical protein
MKVHVCTVGMHTTIPKQPQELLVLNNIMVVLSQC